MKKALLSGGGIFLGLAIFSGSLSAQTGVWPWQDARSLTVEGRGWSDTKEFYDRLPAKAEGNVRIAVWNLSQDSAGLCVRFVTDAKEIQAHWVLRKDALAMPHMPATGVSGLDLYAKDGSQWRWAAIGRPVNPGSNTATLLKGLDGKSREYALYLPLYDGVKTVEIAVPPGATLQPAPERRSGVRPIAFYGTSILQGGCASRPGMAYPAIIGRHLNWPTLNLGFSGNAKSEIEIANLLAELDPAAYVLDPLPNMDVALVKERYDRLVTTIRQAHPLTPIILVENVPYTDGWILQGKQGKVDEVNGLIRAVYEAHRKSGDKNLHYVECDELFDEEREGTVDGTHATDLGFAQMAKAIEPTLRKVLKVRR